MKCVKPDFSTTSITSTIQQIKGVIMKKMLLALLSAGVIAQLLGDVDDQKIKRLIFGAWCYVDNMDAAERAFNSAWNMCGGDSNRFSRLLYEITLTNDVRHSACAMRLLSRYATPP